MLFNEQSYQSSNKYAFCYLCASNRYCRHMQHRGICRNKTVSNSQKKHQFHISFFLASEPADKYKLGQLTCLWPVQILFCPENTPTKQMCLIQIWIRIYPIKILFIFFKPQLWIEKQSKDLHVHRHFLLYIFSSRTFFMYVFHFIDKLLSPYTHNTLFEMIDYFHKELNMICPLLHLKHSESEYRCTEWIHGH